MVLDITVLRKLGLNKGESSVYISLLRLGQVGASMVSKETNIDRATCYRYLDSLIAKGLASYVIENNVKYFIAAHPNKILTDLEEKRIEYKKILPKLIEISNLPKEETTAEVYRGKEGIKTVLREILRYKQDHLVLGDEGHFQDILPIFFEQYTRECDRKKINQSILCAKSALEKVKKTGYSFSKIRAFLNDKPHPNTTIIYSDKIAIFNWQLPYNVIVIKNKDMAQTYREYFELLWKAAR